MNVPFIVGIPTLNRYDCLLDCLRAVFQGTCLPLAVYIVDNGGKLDADMHASLPVPPSVPISVTTPGRNIGVAASWNLLHELTCWVKNTTLVLLNDDITVGKNTCELLTRDPGPCITTALGWSCFRQDHEVWKIVGPYDENFWPGWREDNDYDYRRELAGVRRVIMENDTDHIGHVRSATLAKLTARERAVVEAAGQKGHLYYLAKWNGEPGKEKNKKPFEHLSPDMLEAIKKQWKIPEPKHG